MRERRPGDEPPRYAAGVAASLIAEVAFMAMVAMVAIVRGMDPWKVTRIPASFIVGPAAVEPPGFVAVDVGIGLLMHLLLGVIVGWAYALLLPRTRLSAIAGGVLTGGILYALGFWILPLLFPDRLAPFWLPPTGRALQAVAHVAYGVVLGYAFRKWPR